MFRRDMGLTQSSVVVFSQDFTRSENVRLLVATGSTLTWIPEETALRLGIRPVGIAQFQTADNRSLERPVADAPIECLGIRGTARIAFARPGDANVLGVTALEALGLAADPVRRGLRRVDRYLALRSHAYAVRGSVISP